MACIILYFKEVVVVVINNNCDLWAVTDKFYPRGSNWGFGEVKCDNVSGTGFQGYHVL